jgi:hypothetical protein
VLFAAFFNLVAIFVFHLSVAATVGKGIVEPGVVDTHVVFGALVGAITWNVITWCYGIPAARSHALIGGIVGAVIAKAGRRADRRGIWKTVAFIFVSPLLGFVLGSLMMVSWPGLPRRTPLARRPLVPPAAAVSAGAYSLGHGGNDAQKTIGIIWMLLIATGYAARRRDRRLGDLGCYIAIALGTMFGGWRIVKTMGQKITKLKPVGGFCAGDGRRADAVPRHGAGHPGVDHAHHHRRHRRRRLDPPHACRRCAGGSPATSSGPGSSPSRAAADHRGGVRRPEPAAVLAIRDGGARRPSRRRNGGPRAAVDPVRSLAAGR